MGQPAVTDTCRLHNPVMTVRAAPDVEMPLPDQQFGYRRMTIRIQFDGALPESEWEVRGVTLRCAECGKVVELLVR